jgi:hypothetical protein
MPEARGDDVSLDYGSAKLLPWLTGTEAGVPGPSVAEMKFFSVVPSFAGIKT